MEMLDKTQLQWLLAGIGVVVVVLIYLWGMRVHIREGIRKRRRHQLSLQKEPVFGDPQAPEPSEEMNDRHDFSGIVITPEHPLAKKALIDVEIRPIHRQEKSASSAEESVAEVDVNPIAEVDVNPVAEVDVSSKVEPVAAAEPPQDFRRESAVSGPPKMTVALAVVAVPVGQALFKWVDVQSVALDLSFQLGASGLFERCVNNGEGEPIFSMAHLRKPGTFESSISDDLTTPGLLLFMNLPGPMEEMKALDLLVVTADQLAQRLNGMICDERRKRLTNQGLLHLRNEVVEFRRKQRLWGQSV